MRGKLLFVAGLAVGYVLGTRAGRQRYEQIKLAAKNVWESEPVQWAAGQAQDAVADVADKAAITTVMPDAAAAARATAKPRTPKATPGA
jgi:hypothetical protein